MKIKVKNFENLLSQDEMKTVVGGYGGGTCGWDGGSYSSGPYCGYPKSYVTYWASIYGGHWCCDSCGSSSYCG